MIRGWKNNPEWVKYYQEKQEQKSRAMFQRKMLNMEFGCIQEGMRSGELRVREPVVFKDRT